MTGVYAVTIGLALLVLLLGMLVVGLLRSQAEILRTLNGLGVRLDEGDAGSPIALKPAHTHNPTTVDEIVGTTPEGDPVVKSLVAGTEMTLLAFLSTTCTSCSEFWTALDSDEMLFHNARYRVIVVTLGPDEESPTRAVKLSKGEVDVVMSSEAWNGFNVPGAPYFVLIDPATRGVVGEGSASDVKALSSFLDDAAGDRRWDQERSTDRTDADREKMIDRELRNAGLLPGDPRLNHPSGNEGLENGR